eukprot:2222795-Alexandrium_andersonii.AAC.1
MCPRSSRPASTFRSSTASPRSTCGCRTAARPRRTACSVKDRTSPTRRPTRATLGSSSGTRRSSVSRPWGLSVATAGSCRT